MVDIARGGRTREHDLLCDTIQLEVVRDGKTVNVPVTLEAMGAPPAEPRPTVNMEKAAGD